MEARNLNSLRMIGLSPGRVRSALIAAGLALLGALTTASAGDAEVGRRTALVIGNTEYSSLPSLPGAVSDANRIAHVLEQANFEVALKSNLDKLELEGAVRDFLRGLGKKDIALFYYNGHAIQVDGNNYMLPVDARLSSSYDLEVETYNVSSLLAYMSASSGVQIAILDASTENPLKNKQFNVGENKIAATSRIGLAALEPQPDSLIVYSTAPDQIAVNSKSGESPFTTALSTNALVPNTEIRQILTRVRDEVIGKTDGRQVPWEASGLTSEFYLYQQQGLLIVEAIREVRAAPSASTVELGIYPPITSGDGRLEVSFDSLPVNGALWLDDQKITSDTKVAAADLPRIVLRRASAGGTAELINYTARGSAGQSASGSFSVVFDPAVPDEEPVKPNLVISEAPEEMESTLPKPIQVSMASDVGTGFVSISDADQPIDGIERGWLRLFSRDPGTQIAVGNVVIAPGDLIKAEDIKDVQVRPSLDTAGEDVAIVIAPAAPSMESTASITIKVAVSLNRCDELAGEPLDVQGVTDGLLPNEIDILAAKEACKEAIAANPGVPRFRYEHGRAAYGAGEFDVALAEFQAAYDAGHVRAGMKIARLYQLGAGVARDPKLAIPLLEAGVAKGDPYAQNVLARALITGDGIATDISRGIKLYAEAAESGHTYAINALGSEYLYGRNVPKDELRALRFFEASVAREDVWGYVNLGLMFRDGVGVEKDIERATELFTKANAGGHPYAATLLGMVAREAKAGAPELLGYFRESAERGDAWGAFYAAELLRKEPKLEIQEGEAYRLLALAVSQKTAGVSDQAKDALERAGKRSINMEIQKALQRMGIDIGEVDGSLGKRSRDGVQSVLGAEAPDRPVDILVELVRKEWIDSRPRLDML